MNELILPIAKASENAVSKYDKNSNMITLVNKDQLIDDIKYHIASIVTNIVMKTSPAEQPKRTKVFKELNEIAHRNRKNDDFINDLIPVINYFESHVKSTDSTNTQVHRKNVFGLLDILRKKYAKSSD